MIYGRRYLYPSAKQVVFDDAVIDRNQRDLPGEAVQDGIAVSLLIGFGEGQRGHDRILRNGGRAGGRSVIIDVAVGDDGKSHAIDRFHRDIRGGRDGAGAEGDIGERDGLSGVGGRRKGKLGVIGGDTRRTRRIGERGDGDKRDQGQHGQETRDERRRVPISDSHGSFLLSAGFVETAPTLLLPTLGRFQE